MGHAVEPFDPGARASDRVAEPEPVENGEAERLEEETGPDRPGRVEPFEQADLMAGARQEERRRHAGDAAPDDRNCRWAATGNHRPSLCRDTCFSQRGRVWEKEVVTGISGGLTPGVRAAREGLVQVAGTDLTATIGKTMLFSGLDPDDLRRLAGISRESSLAAAHALFEQGDESDGLYIIVSGIIRIYLTAEDTREATINLLEDGEVIGEMGLLDGLPRSAGAAALTDVKLIFIPREPFMTLLDSSTKLARSIILMLCERLRAANAQVDQAIFHDLRHRLIVLLRHLAVIHGRVEDDVSIVDMELTQGTLAQMLGASREAVNKQLRALAKDGKIAVKGAHIEIFRSTKA